MALSALIAYKEKLAPRHRREETVRGVAAPSGTTMTAANPRPRIALELQSNVFLRPGELRQGKWKEIKWEEREWSGVPADRMKGRIRHFGLPLSLK